MENLLVIDGIDLNAPTIFSRFHEEGHLPFVIDYFSF